MHRALLLLGFCLVSTAVWAETPGILVGLDGRGKVVVERVDVESLSETKHPQAIVVSPGEDGSDRSLWLDRGVTTKLAGATRGLAAPPGGSAGSGEMQLLATTVQLPQLFTPVLPRGAPLLTPVNNGLVLTRRPTFRRMPENAGEKYPAKNGVLYDSRNREVLKLAFAAGKEELPFEQIKSNDVRLAGLPPDRYLLKLGGGLEEVQFTIVDDAIRQSLLSDPEWKVLGGPFDAIAIQYSVERLLLETKNGSPLYLADAYELLVSVSSERRVPLSPYLQRLRGELRTWLERLTTDPNYRPQMVGGVAAGSATGLAAIDDARALLAGGRWTEAETKLAAIKIDAQTDARLAGLVALYRGTMLAEAGLSRQRDAEHAFHEAIEKLEPAGGLDLFRARNNYANYLLRQCDERLHNHAFLMAAGVEHPLFEALDHWTNALEQYRAAAALGEKASPDDRAAIELNIARLYVQLADLIATLDAPVEGKRRFPGGQQAAAAEADQVAGRIEKNKEALPLTQAAAAEIRAHLAHRAGRFADCDAHANRARGLYADVGYLVGVESVERLLGLAAESQNDRAAALRHFQQAHLLAELLRSHFPQDQIGLTRAGFFARRSYVFEKLIDLSIAAGQPLEALRYAERAKARAAQDLFAAAGIGEKGQSVQQPRELSAILANWPKETAALEYYLGTERAYVFLVTTQGQVHAFPLIDAAGRPIASRELVARVRTLLGEMEFQASKMAKRLADDEGFDHAWQETLHRFYRELIPLEFAVELRSAKKVVVVPHHILHYFPFAALVVEPDRSKRAATEMVAPKFLVDESYDLIHAPSLTIWDLLRRKAVPPLVAARAVGLVEVPDAPRLEGVEKDLANFREVFGKKVVRVLEKEGGTESAVTRLLAEPGLLLIASHGNNEPDRPLESHLLLQSEQLAGEESRDGRLTAREIYGTRVRPAMVVLSACYSGLGDRSPLAGDDLFGLQRAFLQSGSKVVVSGLWDVFDDTAPVLIRGYFERIAAGQPAAKALADSQRSFLASIRQGGNADNPLIHPYFWAVYTVAGEDSVAWGK